MQAVYGLLYTERTKVYLSHPITKARNLWKEGDHEAWDSFTQQVQAVSDTLVDSETLAPMFPTTIDERIIDFKIAPVDGQPEVNRTIYLPRLLKRWPSLTVESLWSEVPEHDNRLLDPYDEISGENADEFVERMNARLWQLVVEIDGQINARDHWLVRMADAILVRRPYFRGEPASGVYAEMLYRNLVLDYPQVREGKPYMSPTARFAIAHFPEDLDAIEDTRLNLLADQLRKRMIDMSRPRTPAPPSDEFITSLRNKPELRSLLRSGRISGDSLRQLVDPGSPGARFLPKEERPVAGGALASLIHNAMERRLATEWDAIAANVAFEAIEPLLLPGDHNWEKDVAPDKVREFINSISDSFRRLEV